jgi:uncharacterized protein
MGLAIVGAFLPILPSTPFILLSAWFFSQSSEKWHKWLLDSQLFGPMITNWETNRCISARTKMFAIIAMAFAGGATVVFAIEDFRLRIFTVLMLLTGTATILLIKTCPSGIGENQPDANQ